jgi:Concanavalin A-like lectin/glucanases superfamily
VTDLVGRIRKAYSFNGANNFIEVPDNNVLDLTTELTLSIWVKQNSYNARGMRLIDKLTAGVNNGYLLDVFTTNIRFCGSSAACLGGNTSIDLNVWTNYSVTFNNGNQKLFKNGILISSGNYPSTLSVNSHSLIFGWGHGGGMVDEWFNGSLDDIRIYNRALTDTEVQQLYQSECNTTACNPSLLDVTISNLTELINQPSYTVPREATIHYYLLAKKTSDPSISVKNAVLNYTIGTDPTVRTSLPSDDDGLIDLNITVGGANVNDPDWITTLNTFYPVQFHSLAVGTITGANAFTPFQVKVINKAIPIEEEYGVGVKFAVGGTAIGVGEKNIKASVGGFNFKTSVSAGLSLGATIDGYMVIKPVATNIWNVYLNGGLAADIGLQAKADATIKQNKMGKKIVLNGEEASGAYIKGGGRLEQGYSVDLTNPSNIFKLTSAIFSLQENLFSENDITFFKAKEGYKNLSELTNLTTVPISNKKSFSYGADVNVNAGVQAEIQSELLNLPGYGNIPAVDLKAEVKAEAGFTDDIIFEYIKFWGQKHTNSLNVSASASAGLKTWVSLTKGNRKNNPESDKIEHIIFDYELKDLNFSVTRSIGINGALKVLEYSTKSYSNDFTIAGNTYSRAYRNITSFGQNITSQIATAVSNEAATDAETTFLRINDVAKFLTLNSNSLIGSSLVTGSTNGNFFEQADKINKWARNNSTLQSYDYSQIQYSTEQEITLSKKNNHDLNIPRVNLNLANIEFSIYSGQTRPLIPV